MSRSIVRTGIGVLLAAFLVHCSDDETTTAANGTTTTGQGGTGAQGGMGAQGGSGAAGGAEGGGGEGGGSTSLACPGFPEGAAGYLVGGTKHCYWLVTTPTPQIAANTACGATNAYLATVQSAGENAHVSAVANGVAPIWIGLRCDENPSAACTGNKGNYGWMNGEPVSYDGWAPGEPATPRGAAMHADGQWYGYDALNNPYPYVCEAEAP